MKLTFREWLTLFLNKELLQDVNRINIMYNLRENGYLSSLNKK